MSVETKLMTADELLAMPDDGALKYELVNGELITMSPAGSRHGITSARLFVSLAQYVIAKHLGEAFPADTGFVISRNPDTVRAPDVAFVAAERMVDTEKYFPGAPDLAIEVISPNDRHTNIEAKVREYFRAGTRLVIVVDPRLQTATVRTPSGITELTLDDVITGGDVVPGWSLPMRELFD